MIFLSKLWIQIDFTLTRHKPRHVLFNEWLLDNFNYPWPRFFIFDQQHIYKIFHSLTVSIWNWFLLILHNFENQTQKIFCVEGVFQSAKLVENAT